MHHFRGHEFIKRNVNAVYDVRKLLISPGHLGQYSTHSSDLPIFTKFEYENDSFDLIEESDKICL